MECRENAAMLNIDYPVGLKQPANLMLSTDACKGHNMCDDWVGGKGGRSKWCNGI